MNPNPDSIIEYALRDRHADRPRYSVCAARPHLMHSVHAIGPEKLAERGSQQMLPLLFISLLGRVVEATGRRQLT